MKKNILLLLAFMFFIACSTKKDAFVNRTYHNFTAYYNALFHGKEALKAELKNQKQAYKDDFYSGYIEIFPQNALIVRGEKEISDMASQFMGGGLFAVKQEVSSFQRVEEKALKVIEGKSMIFNGMEKNKEIFNAYLLLAESRIYQGKLVEALDALGQIYFTMPNDKRLPLARIYEGFIYSRMKNFIRAEDIFESLDSDKNLKKEYRRILSIYYAQSLLYSDKKEKALRQLDNAMSFNKDSKTRSRIAFLRGQILSELGRKRESRESFAAAYKYSSDFEFEVKSQIEIAKTFDAEDDYGEAKKYLEKISKKGTYLDRRNEFYYALGVMAKVAGKREEAMDFFQKSIREKSSDNNIRGLAYFEIGESYFGKEEYIKAGAYYDSALAVMEHREIRDKMDELSSKIKNVAKNYYLVKKNDSILALIQMSEPQRVAYFQRHIEVLKEKESKELLAEQERSKRSRRNDSFDIFNQIDFPSFGSSFSSQKSNKFYFSNVEIVEKGRQGFKKTWGGRGLSDNWRVSQSTSMSIADMENKTLGRANAADARRYEVAYYTEKIPTDEQEVLGLKKDRDTAWLGLGRLYEAYFQNTPLATKTLYDLVEQDPEDEVKLQALYLIFSMNFEKNPLAAEQAKKIIIRDFSNTPYARFVKNPIKPQFTQANDATEDVYQKAYQYFTEEKFNEAKEIVIKALGEYSDDVVFPKFELLKAFIVGKTEGKENMILQLQEIVLNYEKTLEGEKAKEILEFLKGS